MSEERKHATFSASFAHVWLNCSGSVVLKKSLPETPPSEAALKGTKAHALADIALSDFLDHKLTGSDPDIRAILLADDPELEEIALGYRDAVFNEGLEGSITGKAYGLEDRFSISDELDMYGFTDFWAVYRDDRGKKAALINDLKTGIVYVDENRNPQLAFYAVALNEELGPFDYVRVGIYQPKAGPKPYRESKFTAKSLQVWKKKFKKVAETVLLKKKYKFKVGEWCEYCPCKGVCTSYANSLESKTGLALVSKEDFEFPTPESLSDELIRKLVLIGGEVEKFFSACKTYALSRFANGAPIPGLKPVQKSKGRRQWNKETENQAIEQLELIGIGAYKKKLRGIGEIERELKKLKVDTKIIDPYLTESKPPTILVPEEDPRPAVTGAINLIDEESEDYE